MYAYPDLNLTGHRMPLFLQPFARYADFNGRTRRAEYWQWTAFQFVISFILGILKATAGSGGSGIILINALFSLAVFIPSLAVTVRRFHDTNRTGWWVLFPSAVACLMTIIFFTVAGAGLAEQMQKSSTDFSDTAYGFAHALAPLLTIVILPTLLACLAIFIFLVLPGTEGGNRFGGDPKGGGRDISHVFDAPEDEPVPHQEDAAPYKPVFDFSPTGKTQTMPARGLPDAPAMQTAPAPMRPANGFSAPARPVFGKRGR